MEQNNSNPSGKELFVQRKPLFSLDPTIRNVDQRWNFIPKDILPEHLRSNEDKFLVNLWLMKFSYKQSITKFDEQYLLRLHQEIWQMSKEDVINEIIQHVNSITHPSKLSEWAWNAKQFNLNFLLMNCPKISIPRIITDDQEEKSWNANENGLKPWKMRSIDLTTSDSSPVSTMILMRLNYLSPQLTGFFLENLLAYHLYGDMETFWKFEKADFEVNDFESMNDGQEVQNFTVEDRNVLLHLLTSADIYMGSDGIVKSSDARVENTEFQYEGLAWPSYLHQLLFASISQSIQKGINIDSYDAINKFIDAFNNPTILQHIEQYSQSMKKMKYVHHLYRFWDKATPFHSIEVSGYLAVDHMLGEMDYKFKDMIVDAKAVKDPTPEKWFAQLYFYKQMGGFDIHNLQVISFLNNKIYTFKEL